MVEQQETTTVRKSFEKNNYILHGYYICVHHEGRICKNQSVFLYLTGQLGLILIRGL